MTKTLLFFLLTCISYPVFAQNDEVVITGKVTDGNGDPIPGVNIFVKNTSIGTISEFDGSYRIAVPAESQFIVFSYIGYLTIEEPINNRSIMVVALVEDTKQLEEIIFTGYSSQKKADVIGSISSLNPAAVKDMPISGIDQALQGQVSGVSVTQSSGTPGGGIMVRIRETLPFPVVTGLCTLLMEFQCVMVVFLHVVLVARMIMPWQHSIPMT
jgi:hypothetical protein